jgi:ubiquinol-cytochrome c reductase cytochrome b subunit
MSLWGAVVITNLFSAFPFVGETIVTWLWGGYAVENPTLNRFFSLHYLLPFMIFGVVMLHVWALHVVGQNNPTGVEVKSLHKDTVPFTPYATVKDAFALCCFFLFFLFFVFYQPNQLGHADNYIMADPLKTPAHIVPEWYFLPFYAILRSIPDKLGGVMAMGAAVLILAFLPWLDTSRVRSGAFRPVFRIFFWSFVVVCVLLGWVGSQDTAAPVIKIGDNVIMTMVGFGQVLTILYFAYFLLALPLLGLFEKTDALPASIADSVLGGGHAAGHGMPVGAAAAPEAKS